MHAYFQKSAMVIRSFSSLPSYPLSLLFFPFILTYIMLISVITWYPCTSSSSDTKHNRHVYGKHQEKMKSFQKKRKKRKNRSKKNKKSNTKTNTKYNIYKTGGDSQQHNGCENKHRLVTPPCTALVFSL